MTEETKEKGEAKEKTPDDSILGTFRITRWKWETFTDKAKEKNSNASAVLMAFVDRFLAGDEIPQVQTGLPANVATTEQVNTAIAALESRLLAEVEKKLQPLS
jgi:hypothetical protein